jgi:uncharacterized SAM-binding protein YcdF (DUF218 family)
MSGGLTGLVELLLVPPGSVLWLLAASLWLLKRRPRWGYGLLGASLGLLLVFSLPLTAGALMSLLEPYPALTPADLAQPRAQAIVVLGAGRRENAAEYGGDSVDALALERLRYAAWLARRTGLPILTSGGLAEPGHVAEAVLMKQVLEREFRQPVRWQETRSRNTYENARYSTAILKAAGIEHIYLVTDAWHEPRAMWSFRQFTLGVTAAPTVFKGLGRGPLVWHDFLPSARALVTTAYACHEILGNLWYRLRY